MELGPMALAFVAGAITARDEGCDGGAEPARLPALVRDDGGGPFGGVGRSGTGLWKADEAALRGGGAATFVAGPPNLGVDDDEGVGKRLAAGGLRAGAGAEPNSLRGACRGGSLGSGGCRGGVLGGWGCRGGSFGSGGFRSGALRGVRPPMAGAEAALLGLASSVSRPLGVGLAKALRDLSAGQAASELVALAAGRNASALAGLAADRDAAELTGLERGREASEPEGLAAGRDVSEPIALPPGLGAPPTGAERAPALAGRVVLLGRAADGLLVPLPALPPVL